MLTAAKRWLDSEDHYYWITSNLAARGLQRTTSRLVALSVFALGVVQLLVMLSGLGPKGPLDRGLAVAVLLCCVVVSSLWLRPRWPSRLQSQLCAGVGTICISVACLIDMNLWVGLAGGSTFVFVSVFAAIFHDRRLLAFTWIVGAGTLVALALRLAGSYPWVAVSAISLFVLINAFVVFVCRTAIRLANDNIHFGELEPLTGLLTRDAYSDHVATMVAARDRDDDRFLAIVVVSLDSFSLLTAINGGAGGNDARVSIGRRLAETLRRDAILAHVGESEYLVADTFTGTDVSVLTERLHHTVRTAPFRLTASIGVAVTPVAPLAGHPPHDIVEELITIATSKMYQARRDGGQRTEAVANPRLTSLEAAEANDWGNDDLTA